MKTPKPDRSSITAASTARFPRSSRLAHCLAALVISQLAATAYAANYTFRILYDQNSAAPVGGGTGPSLNDAGTVAFVARVGSVDKIVTGNGGPVTTIASVGATFSSFGRYPAINNFGTVVFNANATGGLPGIFTGSGGAATNINGSLTGNFTTDLGVPAINDSGTVAFKAKDPTNVNVYIGNGGAPVQVEGSGTVGSTDINNAGVVTYEMSTSVRRWENGVKTTIDTTGAQFNPFDGAAGINSLGHIIFGGYTGATSKLGLYNGTTSQVIAGPPAFSSATEPGINDSDQVIFRGTSAVGNGIFVGTDPLNGRVIYQGMPLFGSTLSEFVFYKHGFNNSGQIAFNYYLSNGGSGIALATPVPEPASILLAAIAAAGLAIRALYRLRLPVEPSW